MRIIDAHSHLGDILEGKGIIYKLNVAKEPVFDPIDFFETILYDTSSIEGGVPEETPEIVMAERARNFTATLQNMQRSLEESSVDYTVCLPILPYVSFEDLLAASRIDPRIIPFTCIDYNLGEEAGKKLVEDVEKGAMGLKIHPIIQQRSLADKLTLSAVQHFSKTGRPVLVHTGVSQYYAETEAYRNTPDYGKIKYFEALVREFPQVKFIAGHAGLFQREELMERMKGLPNVWVDTSFQSPDFVHKLLETFGTEKVMYGSDWPFGNRPPSIESVKIACRNDRVLENMLLFENAANLLQLNI
ncbi:MAG: amidohydrolase family protein [Bacillota bacterium]